MERKIVINTILRYLTIRKKFAYLFIFFLLSLFSKNMECFYSVECENAILHEINFLHWHHEPKNIIKHLAEHCYLKLPVNNFLINFFFVVPVSESTISSIANVENLKWLKNQYISFWSSVHHGLQFFFETSTTVVYITVNICDYVQFFVFNFTK